MVPPGVQIGDQGLQRLSSLALIPRLWVHIVLIGRLGRRVLLRGGRRKPLDQRTGQRAALLQLHVGILVLRDAIYADAPDATVDGQPCWVFRLPFPAGLWIEGFELVGNPVIDMTQQRLGRL